MPIKAGVVLSGCGFKDGAEIHESVCALLALDRAGADIRCYAPNVETAVVDHLKGVPTGEKRNVLVEAARIARGKIEDVRRARASELDILVLPGGFGAARVLSNFADKGAECEVLSDVAKLIQDMHAAHKPIVAICIAPAVIARVLGERHPTLSIGNDKATASALVAMGASHSDCVTTACVTDRQHRIVTTPAYMLGPGIAAVAQGIDRAIAEGLALIGKP